jgi:hypothetical protein
MIRAPMSVGCAEMRILLKIEYFVHFDGTDE